MKKILQSVLQGFFRFNITIGENLSEDLELEYPTTTEENKEYALKKTGGKLSFSEIINYLRTDGGNSMKGKLSVQYDNPVVEVWNKTDIGSKITLLDINWGAGIYQESGWLHFLVSGVDPATDKAVSIDTFKNATFYNQISKAVLATTDNHIPNLGQVKGIVAAAKGTGTALDLSKVAGTSYNYATASGSATFTVDGTKPIAVRGEASTKINVSQATLDTAGLTEPVVYMPDGTTPCTKIPGADFVAGTDMEIWVESMDGVNVRYFFLSL